MDNNKKVQVESKGEEKTSFIEKNGTSYKKHEVLILHNEVSGGSTQLEGIGKKAQNREK